jgi:phosphoglycolate phosphatase
MNAVIGVPFLPCAMTPRDPPSTHPAPPVLFFDLDGPILDVRPRYVAVCRELVADCGVSDVDAIDYWRRKRAAEPEERILFDLVGDRAAIVAQRRLARIETMPYLAHDQPWPWAISVLTTLAERHSLVMVTARAQRSLLMDQLTRFDLLRLFREILSAPAGNNVGEQKAGLIRDYLKRCGLSPQGHWMIGDTEADVDAGKQMGLKTVAILSGIRDEEHLRAAEPDHLLNDIRELSFLWKVK